MTCQIELNHCHCYSDYIVKAQLNRCYSSISNTLFFGSGLYEVACYPHGNKPFVILSLVTSLFRSVISVINVVHEMRHTPWRYTLASWTLEDNCHCTFYNSVVICSTLCWVCAC
jgi:hypothetical protein